jgi:hypothetical protein
MRWVGKEIIIEIQSEIVAIEGYLQFERAICCVKNIFPFPLATGTVNSQAMS